MSDATKPVEKEEEEHMTFEGVCKFTFHSYGWPPLSARSGVVITIMDIMDDKRRGTRLTD